MLKILLFLFAAFSAIPCTAQVNDDYDFKFKNYSTADGLGDNSIVKTVKDKYGFLWIATHNGISRFDGLLFKNYTHNPADSNSLRSIWVSDITTDKAGTIWASTEWGLCFYDEHADRFTYVNDRATMQLVFKMPLLADNKNNIWIAAEDGLKKVNCISKKYTGTSLNRIPDPQFIVETAKDELLIGTRGKGLFKYSISKNTYHLIPLKNLPADLHCMDALQDEEGTWIASSEGLLLLNNDESVLLYNKGSAALRQQQVTQLMCVSHFNNAFGNNKLICGTYNKRLLLFDKKSRSFSWEWLSGASNPGGFEPSLVFSIREQADVLWIGTDRGLKQVNLGSQQQQSFFIPAFQKGNDHALVKKALADASPGKQLTWLIPWQPYFGIVLYDNKQKKITREWNNASAKTPAKYSDIILSAVSNNIIAARDHAIEFFNAEKGFIKKITVSGNPVCLRETAEGNIWIGLEDGIAYVDLKNNKVDMYHSDFRGTDLESEAYGGAFRVNDIKIAENGNLWLAVKSGLFGFDVKKKTFQAHRQSSGYRFSVYNRCSSLELIGPDSVWVATMSGISCFIPSQNRFINFDAASGLRSTYIYSLIKDDEQNLWTRGNADISSFNSRTKKFTGLRLSQQYDVFSFNQSLSFAPGKILLGHEGGFTIFNSVGFTRQVSIPPAIFITECSVNSNRIPIGRNSGQAMPLSLTHEQNQLNFELAAVEYNHPEEITYCYMLQGLEKEWTYAGSKRSISYNYLPHGKYRFAAYALNKRNNTKSSTVYFSFTIKAAWWQHWWIWPLLGFIFTASVIVIARRRIAGIRKKEKEKTALNKMMAELETKMLRSQMNPHFIFNSLNSIQKYIWENKEEDAAEYLSSFAKLIRAILENSRKETVLLKEEIQVMKLYIELEHRRSNAGFDYHIQADEHLFKKQALIPPLIMQPFIENAIWHGLNKKAGKGNLDVQVFEKDGQLVCVIDDDGVGIQQKPASSVSENKSLGIEITRQRIEKLTEHNGSKAGIVITDKKENNLPAGTTVTITLPMQIQNHA